MYVFLLISLILTAKGGDFPSSELDALEDIYISSDGLSWTYDNETGTNNQTQWDFTDPSVNPCMSGWAGVGCSSACLTDQEIDCHVLSLQLARFNMVGTIPSEVAALPFLEVMSFPHNSLEGTVPTALGSLVGLRILRLEDNLLEGSIPSTLCSLCSANLSTLVLAYNSLSQSMPYCLVNANSSLRVLDLSTNALDGVLLTQSAADVADMYAQARGGNDFVHSIQWFNLSDNYFSGAIPPVINQWTALQVFDVSYNVIGGSMVLSSNMSKLVGYDISHNNIGGRLSPDLAVMTNLYEVSVADNLLTGPLTFDGLLKDTNYSYYTLDFSGNLLDGSLPTGLGALLILNTLLLSSNEFSGPLSGIFQANQYELEVMDFNNNALSGEIPLDIWKVPHLRAVSLAKNCLHGSLPTEICRASYLDTLDMDGLHASEACRRSNEAMDNLAQFLNSAPIYNTMYIDGGIPPCIVQDLPFLSSLYLSGNGLSCSIPDIATGGSAAWGTNSSLLSVLTLSNNRLYGSIPQSLQTSQAIQYLDLSHNRLSGTIQHMNYTATMVDMETPNYSTQKHYLGLKANRLSGPIPGFLQYVGIEIDVLAGNMFACDFDELPRKDNEYYHYWCGSLQLTSSWFNILSVVLVSALFLVMVSLIIRHCRCCFGEGSNGLNEEGDIFVQGRKTGCFSLISSVFVAFYETVPTTVARVTKKLLQFPPHRSNSNTPGGSEVGGDLSAGDAGAAATTQADSKYDTGKIHKDVVNVLYLFVYMRRFSVFMVIIGFVLMLPTYCIIKNASSNNNGQGSTHVYQYGWVPSLAYIGGRGEGFTVLVLWSFLMVIITCLCLVMEKARVDKGLLSTGTAAASTTVSSISAALSSLSTSDQFYYVIVKVYLLFFIVLNCVVMVIANGLYVYINITQSPVYGAASLYSLVLFKSFWNVKIVPAMLRSRPSTWGSLWARCKSLCSLDSCSCCCCCCCCDCCGLKQRCCPKKEKSQSQYNDVYATSKQALRSRSIRSATTQCMLLVFNNVLAPAIAVFFSDSSCISQVFRPPAAIESSFTYPKCLEFENSDQGVICTEYMGATMETTFNPPFVYSYQCGSALLTNYVPVFLLMYGVGGILVPCVQWLVVILLQHHWYQQMCVTVGRRLSLDGLPDLRDFIRKASGKSFGGGEEEEEEEAEEEARGNNEEGRESTTLLNPTAANVPKSSLFRMSSQHSDSTDMLRAVPIEDADADADDLVSRASDISNFSEMEEAEKRFAEARHKKVQRQQSLAVVLTVGVISAMHWPILSCPDMSCLTDPKYPNNRYRIQNTTCSCVAGIGVLLSFGMAYPPLALIVAVFVCTQTYLLQSIITAHLNTCAEHQQLAHVQMLHYQTGLQAQGQKEGGHADALQQLMESSRDADTDTNSAAAVPATTGPGVSTVAASVNPHSSSSSVQSTPTVGGRSHRSLLSAAGSMSNRSELNKLHIRYENNWYVALTAVLRKECQGLSSLLYKCSLWMMLFSGVFAALFLFDITMVPGPSIVIVGIAATLTAVLASCRSWYKEYTFMRRQKKELTKHASYQDYRDSCLTSGAGDVDTSVDDGLLSHFQEGCAMATDYMRYCFSNYIYYYAFCGCLLGREGPTVDQLLAEEEDRLYKDRSLAPLIDASVHSELESNRSSYRDSSASSLAAGSFGQGGAGTVVDAFIPPPGMLRTHTEHTETSEADGVHN